MKYEDCKTEQSFKMLWIKNHKKDYLKLFCIETEETVKGFPDVLGIKEVMVHDKELNEVCKVQQPVFIEFKIAKKGWIKFQPTQPAFYKANKELNIFVCALCEHRGNFYIHGFNVQELFREGSMYKMDDMNQVDLNPMSELLMNGGEVE